MQRHKLLTAFLILFGVTASVFAITRFSQGLKLNTDSSVSDTDGEDFGQLLDDDPLEEFKRIMHNYKSDLDAKGTINLFKNDEKGVPFEKTSFMVSKRSVNYFYRVDSVDIIQTGAHLLTIDHRAGMMLIDSSLEGMKNGMMSLDSMKVILDAGNTKTALFINSGMKLLRIENTGDPAVYAIRIYYHPQTYEISKIVYDIAQSTISGMNIQYPGNTDETSDSSYSATLIDTTGERISITAPYDHYIMEVRYNSWRRGNELVAEIPVIKDYLEISNNEFKLKEKYSGYEFFNAIIQTNQD